MPSLNDALRNRSADSFGTAFDSGTLQIRTGASPGAGAAATGTLLATITLPADSFGAAASGVAAKAGTWSATAAAGGTAGYGRFTAGSFVMDVGIGQGSGELSLDNTTIVQNGTVTVNTFTLTQPAGSA